MRSTRTARPRALDFRRSGLTRFFIPQRRPKSQPGLSELYNSLEQLSSDILEAQQSNHIRALVLHSSSPRPTQTVSLGGYLFQTSLSRSWPARNLLADHGAMMILERK